MTIDRSQSEAWYARACKVIPGGVHSPVRAFKSVGGTPVYIDRAEGAYLWDLDGNRALDFQNSWGPLILGHGDPDVLAAVAATAPRGLSYGATHRLEVELAELVVSAFSHAEMCRFVSSGTEAVMTALRLARGATGRSIIVKFSGGYHGHIDSLLVRAGSGLITAAEVGTEPTSAGIPHDVAATTLVAKLGDLASVQALFEAHGAEIAAVIIEPMPANNGLLLQSKEFLAGLRAICDAHGSLLIFDEVISGFRLQFGGYGDRVGVRPDLTTLGKIIGGGMPVGAVVGPQGIVGAAGAGRPRLPGRHVVGQSGVDGRWLGDPAQAPESRYLRSPRRIGRALCRAPLRRGRDVPRDPARGFDRLAVFGRERTGAA